MQIRLFHQRQHRVPERLEIRCEVEEGDLYPVAARPLQTNQLVHDVLGAADDLDVAPKGAVLVTMLLPGDRVAGPMVRDEAFPVISRIEDSLVIALRLASVSRQTILGLMIVRSSRPRSAPAALITAFVPACGRCRVEQP
jgi:hypothetical protein